MNPYRNKTGAAMAQNDALNETQVCSFWKEFELDSVRSKLDEEGLGIASHQEASVKHRRQLAEATKGACSSYADFHQSTAPDIPLDLVI